MEIANCFREGAEPNTSLCMRRRDLLNEVIQVVFQQGDGGGRRLHVLPQLEDALVQVCVGLCQCLLPQLELLSLRLQPGYFLQISEPSF